MPYPPNDGGAIAMLNMAKGLKAAGCDLTILTYNTQKHFFDTNKLPSTVKNLGPMYAVEIDTSVKPLGAFFNLFSSKSYNISRFDQESVREELKLILANNQFDIIHFEGLFTSMYVDLIRQLSPKSILVLRQHNIEYKIWERMAAQASFPKKAYLKLLARRLKKYELKVYNQFDAIVPITEVDQKVVSDYNSTINTFVSPTGVDSSDYINKVKDFDQNSVFHFGSLNWMPNVEGVKWFLENAWPIINEAKPELKFFIAGRDMPDWISDLNGKNNVVVVGEVDDAAEFYGSKNVMVVPLLSGSGMRIKMIEGMAAGKPIVSTKIGAEGIDVTPNKDVIITDDPESFAKAVIELINNKEKAVELGRNAQSIVETRYSNDIRVTELVEYYKSIVN